MARLLKALPLTLALVALVAITIATISCGSTGTAQVRVINAIPDATSALDVDFNGVATITKLAFGTVDPTPTSPAAYLSATAGTVTVQAFYTGQTVNPILEPTTATLTGGDQYTVLLAGFVTSPPSAYLISDDNQAPTANTVKFRVINASASSSEQYPGGFDIYILPPGQSISGIPQIPGLTLGQTGPGYVAFNYSSSYTVWVTAHKSTLPLLSTTYPQKNPQITTLVIVDQSNGATFSQTMLPLIDLQ
jgi:hypothetical protein